MKLNKQNYQKTIKPFLPRHSIKPSLVTGEQLFELRLSEPLYLTTNRPAIPALELNIPVRLNLCFFLNLTQPNYPPLNEIVDMESIVVRSKSF